MKKRLFAIVCLVAAIVGCESMTHGEETQVVLNGSFEELRDDRPAYWSYRFFGEPRNPALGDIGIDEEFASHGEKCLVIKPLTDEGLSANQILHTPTGRLRGKTVRMSADIRTAGPTYAYILVIAYNPNMPPDPDLGIPSAGKAFEGQVSEDGFIRLSAEFTASENAEFLLAAVGASGNGGRAYIDNVEISVDVAKPAQAPVVEQSEMIEPELRGFPVGFVNESPIDASEKGREKMVELISRNGEMINLFFHLRYNALLNRDMVTGHEAVLETAKQAQSLGLERAVTLDFTHDGPAGVGYINPMPDGTKVEKLTPRIQRAYVEELMALCRLVEPTAVMIGIEANLFYWRYPEQWQNYVDLFKRAYSAVKSEFPQAHVTAYFTLEWMVNQNGRLKKDSVAVWQKLLPEIDSIAYSVYLPTDDLPADKMPEGFFTAVRSVAPDKPLAIPEFGIRSEGSIKFNENNQAKVLKRIFEEVGPLQPAFMVYFSLYDQKLLGAPLWYRSAFAPIGLFKEDGTPKKAWALWTQLPRLKSKTGQ